MRVVFKSLIISLILTFCLCAISAAQQAGRIESMKLLAPDVGWAAANQKLFWTVDNGSHWKDITPPHGPSEILKDVFFLDESNGWALLDAYEEQSSTVSFHLAVTANSGRSWTVTPVMVPSQKPDELAGNGWLDFVDPLHGWVVLQANSGSAFSWGLLLSTEDGGKNWKELTQAPIAGHPIFATARDGWISGNGGGGGIYSTHDGGKTWSGAGASLQDLPPSLPTSPWYEDVKFTDAKHGRLPIYFSSSPGEVQVSKGPVLVLYVTDDGGRTWKLDRTLVDPSKLPRIGASAVVPDPSGTRSVLVAAFDDEKHPDRVTLMTLADPGVTTTETAPRVSSENVLWRQWDLIAELSFVTGTQGWARTHSGDLLLTADGGATWRNIDPVRVQPAVPLPPSRLPLKHRDPGQGSTALAPPPTLGLAYHEDLAFDKLNVIKISEMLTWWDASPFFDVGFYVGGINYCGQWNAGHTQCLSRTDPGLSTSWLTQAQGYGWGFLPIWVGPQAPCVIQTGLTKFTSANAAAQGTANATSAAAGMAALGLSGTMVFYNMENYTDDAQHVCSTAVRAFLTAWVSGMNANGYATTPVYGNPAPAQNDFKKVAGLTELWVAKYPFAGNPPNITIWGLSPLCDPFSTPPCTLWSNHQRIHQYLANQTASYGDNNSITVDPDIVDAQVVAPPASAPGDPPPDNDYTYTITAIGSGATSTTPTGINDEGVVVGYASVPEGTLGCPIFDWCGFIYSGGTYTWVQQQLQGEYVYTYFTGINDLGTVVGYSGIYGFSYIGGSFTALSYPSAYSTLPEGINDDGTVVGTWGDGQGNFHGFVEFGGTYTSFDYPGAQDTYLYSINGDGVIGGSYYTSTAGFANFIYNFATGIYLTVPGYPGATSSGVAPMMSNNGQTPGLATLSGAQVLFLYDENSGSFVNLPSNITVVPSTMNDLGQLIGGVGSSAYLATPQ